MNSQETVEDLRRRLAQEERALREKAGVETALRASEERYRAFVTAGSDAVYRMSPDWSEMRRLHGRMFLDDTEEPSGDWADTYILPEDRDVVFSAIQQAVRGKRMFELEHRVRRADGGIGWTLSRAVPILTDDGEITEWFGTASDITDKREADARLRASEERQAFLLTLSDALRPITDPYDVQRIAMRTLGEQLGANRALYFEVAADGDVLSAGPSYVRGVRPMPGSVKLSVFGEPVTERFRRGETVVIGDTLRDPMFGPEFTEGFATIELGAVIGVPLVKDGRLVAILAAHQTTAREWTEADVTLAEAVAERTWAAVERARAEAALRESEARFRQFAASSADGLWIRDAATLTMEYVSPAIQTIYGVPPETLLGDPARWTALIVPEDRETALRHLEQACRGKTIVHQFRIRRPSDGALRWIRDTDFPLLDEHGRVQRIGGIAQDVTEAKSAAGYQKVLQHELQHRVRNILALLRSVATRTGETSDTVEQFASHLRGRLDALARTQAVLTRAPGAGVDLESMMREELLAQAAKEEQVSVAGPAVRLAPKTAEVLALAVHELATNAVKYGALSAPGGHVDLRWSVTPRDGSDWLGLTWTETGVRVVAMAPRRVGFGTELIERRVPYELDGRGELDFRPGGVRCTIDLPLRPGDSILQTDAP